MPKTEQISGEEARKQFEKTKLRMGKGLYEMLTAKYARPKARKTAQV